MATKETSIHRCIRTLADRQRDDLTSDRELLRRFAVGRDMEAFAALFRRHGAMVLGVAARVLHQHADAEDVRQATFLLLAKKAGALPWRDSVAGWLYAVAHRLALQSRHAAQRRQAREARVKAKPAPDALADITLRDLQTVLDEELRRLPRKYSAVLILCCLEGKARDEAAQYLGLPLATVKSRLETGREMLRSRLTRRGLTLSVVLAGVSLPAGVVDAALPMALARAASQAAVQLLTGQSTAGVLSADVLALVNQGARAMSLTKLKITVASLVVGGLTLLAFGVQGPAPTESAASAQQTTAAQPAAGPQQNPPRSKNAPKRVLEPELGQEVMAVKYSSTGEWLATAEMNGTVRLWNTKTQRPGPVLRGPEKPEKMVRSVVFTPDSTAVIAGCDDGKIYVWDVPAGKLRTTLVGHRGQVCAVALTADGKTLASCGGTFEAGSSGRRELKIWDLARAKCVRDIECPDDICTGAASSMVFVPGTDLLAAGCIAPFRGIKVWNTTTGKEDRRFTHDGDFPLALAISPDGKRLAVGSGNTIPAGGNATRGIGILKIWDWNSGKLERTLMDNTDGYFRAVAFSKDGTRLIAGCEGPSVTRNNLTCTSNVVYCWEAKHWTRLWATQGLFGVVWALDIAPDGQSVTCSSESGASLLETCLGRVQGQWLTTSHRVIAEDFGPRRVLHRPDLPDGLANAIDLESRIYARWRNGTETFCYRGQARAVNEALRKYAAVKGVPRHLLLLPGPGYAHTLDGKPIGCDWQIHVPGALDQPVFGKKDAMMAIYISALKPRPVDRPKVDRWLKDLDSDQFDVRAAAHEALRALGNDARPALRAALKDSATLETRRRIESLLNRLPGFDLTDLEIPKGVTVIDAGDLIANGLRGLKNPDRHVRSGAIQELSGLTRLSDKVVPALVEVAEKDKDVHLRQVAAACLAEAKDMPAEQERIRREQAIAQEIQAWKNANANGR